MKKSKNVSRIFCLVLLSILLSCSEDDKPKGKFEHGVFIVNEGNFNSADGSVSFYNRGSGEVVQDIFGSANNGLALGDVVQSMTIHDDLAYIVVNNDNKVEVVNANTFVTQYTLPDVKMPRYFTTYNNKGYLTEWVSFSEPGRVSVIDIEKHTVIASIITDFGAENIIEKDGKLYVSNNFSTTVSVVDPSKNEVIKTINVGTAPGSFVVDKDNKLWVVCGGGTDLEFNPLNDGAIYRINTTTDEVDKNIELAMNVSTKIAINKTKDKIYFYSGNSVYELSTTATEAPATALITEAGSSGFYGIGFDPEVELIYVTDAKGFTGGSTVYRYNTSGSKVDSFASGRGANSFVFK